ncbi:cytochrome P450 CYP72A219-like [Impatiens glandulifera]|uniref:cytochrome P450 CYP72A219-like n=1 Tax=Impatiens glandulifera TaxID=253017 RepID=UPI001FB0CD81|nr:cytochrome P450 CYP72A219-like [Impatiens glandulifera]
MDASYMVAVALAMAVWYGWKFLEWIWLKPKRMEKHLASQGFRGNPYRIMYGDLKDYSAAIKQARSAPITFSDDILKRIFPFLHQNVQTYGKNTFIWIANIPRVYIMEPDLIKEVLSKNFNYLKAQTNPLTKLLVTGVATYDLDQWTKHRKIVNPAFHMEKLKLMLPAFQVSCGDMITAWQKAMKTSKELDIWPYFQSLTADAISRTAFGNSYEQGRKIFKLLQIQADLLTQALRSIYIPGSRFLPTKRNMRMKSIYKELDDLLIDLIKRRMKDLEAGEANKEDLLNILLECNNREANQHQAVSKHGKKINMGMTIKDVVEECKLFYFAGQETTSSLLLWTMYLLSQHQEWQHRAREEVLQVFGKNNKPDFDGLNRLKIVTMILYEVLRIFPPAAELNRFIKEDVKLGESLHLQAGTSINLPIIFVHQDKEIWGDDAKEFKPERFAEGILKATKGQVSYFPFSCGPRVCVGQNFSMLEAKMTIAMILQRFAFELSPNYIHAPYYVLTIQPQFGVQLIMHEI